MATRNHQDVFTRGRRIVKLEEGSSVTSVAQEFEIDKSIVSRAWKAFQMTGTAVRKVGGGRPRKTISSNDRYIVVQAERDRNLTAGNIPQQLNTVTG